jgi:hypothetical protein
MNLRPAFLSLVSLLAATFAQEQQAPDPKPALGMNLAGPSDWNTELPFVDVFRLSRRWISQKKGEKWGKGPDLTVDEHGWVKTLEPDCWAETPLCTIRGGHYPSGQYTVLYEGTGKLAFWGAAKEAENTPGRILIDVDASKGGFWLRIMQTDPTDYIRNIRVIMPGFAETYTDNPFHPAFLKRWQGMACLRFMDFMHTNNSKIETWADRPKLTDATWTTDGIPLEIMADLANRQDADPWFCMPHLADDDYVRRFAQQAKELLEPERKVYIEWSNETWNGIFSQSRYAGQKGQELKFADKPWEAGWRYTAYRSVRVFQIWEEVFGGTDRLVRVLPTQAANAYVSERIVEFQDAYRHADALAVAPYISFNVPAQGNDKRPGAEQVAGWTADQVLDHMETICLPTSIQWLESQKKIADKYGLRLVAYEGGQHATALGAANRNKQLVQLLADANGHPRMGELYTKYFAAWEAAGGDLFCNFSSIGTWGTHGSWGLLQHYDDDPAQSPKFVAVMQWAAKLGQPVSWPEKAE